MAINTTPKEMPTGDGHPTAGNAINDQDFLTCERNHKAFSKLREAYALEGHTLHRTDPSDGPATYWAERWGLVRYLPSIDTVRRFLEQIGGRL